MPIYKYKCPKCGDTIELGREYEKRDDVLVCFTCASHNRRVFLDRVPHSVALTGFDNYGRSK